MNLDISTLESTDLFRTLPQAVLQKIAATARARTYPAGEAIVHQEDPGQTLYVVLSGTVKVSTTLPDGSAVFLALLAAGDTFGELSLIDTGGRSADVETLEASSLLIIDSRTFNELIDTTPAFTRNLLSVLSRRLRLANVRIQAHCTLDVYGLVARQILEFAELYGRTEPDGSIYVPIRLTQGSMADLVGASRERVNQVMVSYRKSGLITVDTGYRITVLQPEALRHRTEA
ncbi:MAG: Crp/Fnr family transcriptional regulator [Armatimonadetes bacterium]|nr:Crp/Fnr family transcriptional regulator [Armatimonadota bacterium]MDE2206180.1 Crp/Fnr family transcriptional regulator [Armatimonadota bacterium]